MELYTRTDKDPDIEVTIKPFTHAGVTIPEGFCSDGASAPRILWSIIPPFKRTKKAAFIHDYLCREAKNSEDRKKADKVFFNLLKESGLNPIRCRLGYVGVRLGALLGIGIYYNK